MANDTDTLETTLLEDLDRLGDRLVDEEFTGDLYRGLANTKWSKDEGPDGWVALSWTKAERLVNELRARHDREPMRLAQTGGEGWVSDTVAGELGRLGWRHRPLNTDTEEPSHAGAARTEPPRFHGEEAAGAGNPREERGEAHEAAEAERRRTVR